MDASREDIMNGNLGGLTTYRAGIAQAAMHRSLQKLCDEVLKPFGVSKMQWLIIGAVLDAGIGGLSLSRLATEVGTTLPYMTTSVRQLEAKGMLVRKDNRQDGRSKLIAVADDFVPRCGEIERVLRQALRETIYAEVDPREFRVYMKVLYQLRQAVA